MVIRLPISATYDAPINWMRYRIRAITYHIGMEVTSGHYRTMVRTQQSSTSQEGLAIPVTGHKQPLSFPQLSPEKKQLIKSKTPALPMEEVFKLIQEIQACLQDGRVTLKFHSLKKMSTDTTTAVPFLWTVSHRVAPNLWHLLQRLASRSTLAHMIFLGIHIITLRLIPFSWPNKLS